MEIPAGTLNSAEIRDQFLTLLVAQLRNQDPLEPVGQQEFLQQLAEFSTLEAVENLNTRFADLLRVQELTSGVNLIGRTVSYTDPDTWETQTGRVEQVQTQDSRLQLTVNDQTVSINDVLSVFAGN